MKRAHPTARVVIVGDVMLDEYLRGSVRRISPEAPVPVLEAATSDLTLGGAANVAHNLATLGAEVRLVGVVGSDAFADQLSGLCRARAVDASGLVRDPGRVTTHKLRVVAQGQHVLRIDREQPASLSAGVEQALVERALAAMEGAHAVVLSDYLKGCLTEGLLRAVIDGARARGLPVLVDPKGERYERYRGADVLTPNVGELAMATGLPVDGEAQLLEAARRLRGLTGARTVLVTCGKEGMLLVGEGAPVRIAAEAREVYDVTGAGDTVIAAFALGLVRGLSDAAAARLANTAAGVVVGKLGTATVTLAELESRRLEAARPGAGKVVELPALLDLLAAARAQDKAVVFTNGCFDLVHAGHVDYLEVARRQGDLLVVGLNTDASVKRLKGPTRPLVPGIERARVLAGLACVDYVVLFDEDTPQALIEAVRPDVLVKGADYKPEQVVGADFVKSYGGRLELVPLTLGQSTSKLIERILLRSGG